MQQELRSLAEIERDLIRDKLGMTTLWEDCIFKHTPDGGTYRKFYWYRLCESSKGRWGYHVRDYVKWGYPSRAAARESAMWRIRCCVLNDSIGNSTSPHMKARNQKFLAPFLNVPFIHVPHNDLRAWIELAQFKKVLMRSFKGKQLMA